MENVRGDEMGPEEAIGAMIHCVKRSLPFLLVGPPGVGKTALSYEVRRRLGCDGFILHPMLMQPHRWEGMGMVAASGDHAKMVPFEHLHRMVTADKLTFVWLDEVGQVSVANQMPMAQVIWDRMIGGYPISEHVRFGMATNRKEDKAGVNALIEPLKSRGRIMRLVVKVEDWIKWAGKVGMPDVLIAYISWFPEALYDFKPTAEIENSPLPRNWERVGWTTKDHDDVSEETFGKMICGDVGYTQGMAFSAFMRMYNHMPSQLDVVRNPETADIPEHDPAAMAATCSGLAHMADASNIANIMRYVGRFTQRKNVARMLAAIERDHPQLMETGPVNQMRLKHIDLFL